MDPNEEMESSDGDDELEDFLDKFERLSADQKYEILLYALEVNQELVEHLVKAGVRFNGEGKPPHTMPLHLAAQYGNKKNCRILIEDGAFIEALDSMENTPLLYAVEYGHLNTARYLIRQGANVNAKNKSRNMPIHRAVRKGGKLEMLMLLMEHGSQLDDYSNFSTPEYPIVRFGFTPLLIAIDQDMTAQAIALLERGARPDVCFPISDTPLLLAIKKGNLQVVEKILQLDPDKSHSRGKRQKNALDLAINHSYMHDRKKQDRLCVALKKHGFTVTRSIPETLNAVVRKGLTCTLRAIVEDPQDNIAALIKSRDIRRVSLLNLAAISNNRHLVRHIMKLRQLEDAAEENRNTPSTSQ